mgnify:CR=1 FL=1
MRELTEPEVEDILLGCSILGTGGGGDPARGLALIRSELDAGRKVRLASMDELPDDAWGAAVYYTGSTAPRTREQEAAFARLKVTEEPEAYRAFRALERHLGVELAFTVSVEYGGMNTAVPMAVAARAGLPVLDADAAGRAVPDLQFSTYYLKYRPISPMGLCNRFGEEALLGTGIGDFRAEDLVRSLAVASGGMIATADHPARLADLRDGAVIPGALTLAGQVGRAVREAREQGGDPATAAAAAGGGLEVFHGRAVTDPTWEDRGGFLYGEMELEGLGAYRGSRYRIWYKNENAVAWLDGEPDVSVPDLICVLRPDGEPVMNPRLRQGEEFRVLAFPAPREWLTPRGLEILVPSFFGFDIPYRPVRERMKP